MFPIEGPNPACLLAENRIYPISMHANPFQTASAYPLNPTEFFGCKYDSIFTLTNPASGSMSEIQRFAIVADIADIADKAHHKAPSLRVTPVPF